MTETNGDDPLGAAANDDDSAVPGRVSPGTGWGFEPCGDAGFDECCRDPGGALCPYYAQHCHAPDYPCLDMLRHQLALDFLEELARRRGGISSSASHRAPR
jgi:hypothetical protein